MSNIQEREQEVKPVEQYSDDALAEMAEEFAKKAEHLGRMARGAHAELLARMLERKGTKLDTEHWTGTVKPGSIRHSIINDDVLGFRKRLATLLSKDQIEAAFVQPPAPPMRVDHRFINDYHKQGGVVAAVIAQFRKSIQGESVLTLKRKV